MCCGGKNAQPAAVAARKVIFTAPSCMDRPFRLLHSGKKKTGLNSHAIAAAGGT
jgi:hypothetical protein